MNTSDYEMYLYSKSRYEDLLREAEQQRLAASIEKANQAERRSSFLASLIHKVRPLFETKILHRQQEVPCS